MKRQQFELLLKTFDPIREYLYYCGWIPHMEPDNDIGSVICPQTGRKYTIDYALTLQWDRDRNEKIEEK